MPAFPQQKLKGILEEAFPDEEFASGPKLLEGGNLNNVWRAQGKYDSYIIKHAPPHIASAPEVALDPNRILIEAEMLKLFGHEGEFSSLTKPKIRAPKLYFADCDSHMIIMEDIAPHQELDGIAVDQELAHRMGGEVGALVGSLHSESLGSSDLQKRFDNRSIQQTRLDIQYKQVAALLKEAGCTVYKKLGQKAEQLGRKYLKPGKCLIMGDLWPRSVMIDPKMETVRLIDWEFAHYGRPAQDIAHLAAHCWMMAHRAPDEDKKIAIKSFWQEFIEHYQKAAGTAFDKLWDKEEREDASIHFGCEILVRTVGNFKQGYLYENLQPDSTEISSAVERAAESILSQTFSSDIF